ncbi:DUF4493 domain-containing protein [Phocaeicola barnesiae]|uniref:DUF4493 domain-containing protein n=1 Tax=Phocaeicola barnesiae TaxID=376804 RepID=UPI0025A44ADC|nr:DUF4493 domain-containing protein [Phocaeicola barnesiae]MDM8308638.1 DUF4493 domain-containing protein [Phocaeicola barnesiae]
MKQTILYFIAGLFFLTGCTQEEPSLTESNQVGYLTVEDLTLQQAEQISVGSRAVDPDLYVEITDTKATTTYNPGMVPAKIELAVGTCTVKAYNAAYKDDTSNAAKYYAETTVEIKEGKVEYLSLEVPMVNYGVTLSLPDNFSDWFSDYTFSIGKSAATETFSLKEDEVIYFDYQKGDVLSYSLKVTSKEEADGPFTQTGSYGSDEGKAIEAGKIYRITYNWETKALEIN